MIQPLATIMTFLQKFDQNVLASGEGDDKWKGSSSEAPPAFGASNRNGEELVIIHERESSAPRAVGPLCPTQMVVVRQRRIVAAAERPQPY